MDRRSVLAAGGVSTGKTQNVDEYLKEEAPQ
jgi:hypothetical protein